MEKKEWWGHVLRRQNRTSKRKRAPFYQFQKAYLEFWAPCRALKLSNFCFLFGLCTLLLSYDPFNPLRVSFITFAFFLLAVWPHYSLPHLPSSASPTFFPSLSHQPNDLVNIGIQLLPIWQLLKVSIHSFLSFPIHMEMELHPSLLSFLHFEPNHELPSGSKKLPTDWNVLCLNLNQHIPSNHQHQSSFSIGNHKWQSTIVLLQGKG